MTTASVGSRLRAGSSLNRFVLARAVAVSVGMVLTIPALLVAPSVAFADSPAAPAASAVPTTPMARKVTAGTGIRLTVLGLPTGLAARVVVTGPTPSKKQAKAGRKQFKRLVSASTTLRGLTPGRYRVAAFSVNGEQGSAVPTRSSRVVKVRAKKMQSLPVQYRFTANENWSDDDTGSSYPDIPVNDPGTPTTNPQPPVPPITEPKPPTPPNPTPVQMPGKPTNLEIDTGTGWLTASWSPPVSDGGAPVTGYQVQVAEVDSIGSYRNVATCSRDSVNRSCKFSGLKNFTTYRFEVIAKNTVGMPNTGAVSSAYPHTCVLDAKVLDADGRSVQNHDLRNCDFSGQSFGQVDMTTLDFRGSSFANTHFRYSGLDSNDFTGVDFTGARLDSVVALYDNFTNANFTNAVISTRRSYYSVLTGINVEGADLSRLDVRYVTSGHVRGTPTVLPDDYGRCGKAHLVKGFFIAQDVDLTGADLSGADLSNMCVGGTLAGVNLSGANLTGARLVGASSGGVIGMPQSLPAGWRLTHGYLVGAGANLKDANLAGADLSNMDLSRTNDYQDTNLWRANLAGTNFTGTDLTHASMYDVDLTGAILTRANVSWTYLEGATMTGVISGGVTGTPGSLPDGWKLVNGVFTQI